MEDDRASVVSDAAAVGQGVQVWPSQPSIHCQCGGDRWHREEHLPGVLQQCDGNLTPIEHDSGDKI